MEELIYKKVAKAANICKDKLIENVEEGELCFKQLLSMFPDDGIIYYRMGEGYKELFERTGNAVFKEKAIKSFQKAREILPFLAWQQKAENNLNQLIQDENIKQLPEGNFVSPILYEVIKAVEIEIQRIKILKNRPHYYMFGKTFESERIINNIPYYEVGFGNFHERIIIDAEFGKKNNIDLRIESGFIKGIISRHTNNEIVLLIPLTQISYEKISKATENGIYYIADFKKSVFQLRNFLLKRRAVENEFILYLIRSATLPYNYGNYNHINLNKYKNKYQFDQYKWQAIEKALTQNITFIWGPPGTGKTTVLAALAHILLEETDKNILFLTLSNSTLDSLFIKVIEYVHKYSNKPYPEETFTRLGKIREKSTPKEIAKYYRDKISLNSRIVAANYQSLIFRNIKSAIFDYVIMDEVSMTPIPLLVAGSFFAKKNLILAGDPYQLPPPYPEDADLPNDFYSMNVFEKVKIKKENDPRAVFLKTQYRMHQDISNLVSELFYDGKLECGNKKIEKLSQNGSPFPKSVLFRNTEGVLEKIGSRIEIFNRKNDPYAFADVKLAKNIIKYCDIKPEQIGIIVPYNAQVCNIYRYLKKENLEGIKVNTVHSFQGQEKDVIIYDITDDNIEPSPLTTNWKFLNVALSRARRFLCVIGNQKYLMSSFFNAEEQERFRKIIEHGKWNITPYDL